MNQKQSHKVFISHSSKDKTRFVVDFAERLRKAGIDAWLDKWEILVGDSLVDRIFEEGIKNCDVFIIILSKNSIDANWVKSELNAGIVNKIEKQTKLIPVIIDDNIQIPTALINTKWQKIADIKQFDLEFDEIKNSILGVTSKPKLGVIPKHAVELTRIGDLSPIDSMVLKLIVEHMIKHEKWTGLLVGANLQQEWKDNNISEEEVKESLEILNDEHYLTMTLTTSGWFGSPFTVQRFAVINYAQNYIENLNEKVRRIISCVINEDIRCTRELAGKCELNIVIVNSILEEWSIQGYFQIYTHMDTKGNHCWQGMTAKGKRYFKEKLG